MAELFNPNELLLEKIKSIEEYNLATDEIEGRYTMVEDPSLTISTEGTEVTDAFGSVITTFYNAATGELSFTNSLHSLDLMASQFGSKKKIATAEDTIITPVSETIAIASDNTVTLKYVPVGTVGAEVAYLRLLNDQNEFGDKYTAGTEASEENKTFVIDAASKKITMPEGATGRVFVSYEKESDKAVMISKTTDGRPEVKKLLVHAIFHDKCNENIVYYGVIVCYKAKIDPSSVELNLTPDGKHGATYTLSKDYCDDEGKLIDVIVYKD